MATERPRTCKECGSEFYWSVTGRSPYCPEHRAKFTRSAMQQRTLRYYAEKYGKRTAIMFHEVRNFCRSWNKHLLGPCQGCGYDKHVEMCHIKGIATFDLDTPLGIVNDEKNVVILCRNCHWELDHGMRPLSSLTPRPCPVLQAHAG